MFRATEVLEIALRSQYIVDCIEEQKYIFFLILLSLLILDIYCNLWYNEESNDGNFLLYTVSFRFKFHLIGTIDPYKRTNYIEYCSIMVNFVMRIN